MSPYRYSMDLTAKWLGCLRNHACTALAVPQNSWSLVSIRLLWTETGLKPRSFIHNFTVKNAASIRVALQAWNLTKGNCLSSIKTQMLADGNATNRQSPGSLWYTATLPNVAQMQAQTTFAFSFLILQNSSSSYWVVIQCVLHTGSWSKGFSCYHSSVMGATGASHSNHMDETTRVRSSRILPGATQLLA